MAGAMASYGAYYYSGTRPETRAEITRPDAISRREDCRSPPPGRYGDRPKTPGQYTRRRSITPPDERRPIIEYERPRNPSYGEERPMTTYVPPQTATQYTPPPNRPPERKRAPSPDVSILSELSEPEIKPNYSTIDFYTYSKCIERVISDSQLTMPLRLGIFGKWGSGKTRITQGILWCLKQACCTTCNHISEPVEAPRARWMYRLCFCCDVSFFVYLALLTFLLVSCVTVIFLVFLLAVAPYLQSSSNLVTQANSGANLTTTLSAEEEQQNTIMIATISILLVIVFILCICGLIKCSKDRYLRGAGEMFSHFYALVIMALCETPPPPTNAIEKVEMIPISFNVAEFTGTTDSWSALTEVLMTQCETMFGYWKTRFYRVCTRELEHEHDALIANPERWRCAAYERITLTHGPMMPSYSNKQQSHGEANHTAKINKNNITNDTKEAHSKKSLTQKPSFRATKSNKIVATEETSYLKVDVPVSTAKWRTIPYTILIMIFVAMITVATVVLVVTVQSVDSSNKFNSYFYTIVGSCAAMIVIPILTQLKNFMLLLHSLYMSPARRINRLRQMCEGSRKHLRDIHGFMHKTKVEIALLMGFIRQMEHIYQRRFRILLILEDLDKCADDKIHETLNAIKILLGDQSFPVVTMINMDPELVGNALTRAGIQSGQNYLNQYIDMKYCIPDLNQGDIVKFLECHTEHLLCSTSTRVNRLKEVADRKYKTSKYHESRRDLIRQLDVQHDYEERIKSLPTPRYYSYPTSARYVSTAKSRHSKSSKSNKKRVIFTPIRSTSEEGLLEGPPSQQNRTTPLPAIGDKTVIPPVNKPDPDNAASPLERRKQPSITLNERPESQLSRVKSPLGMVKGADIRRASSALAEESSDDEQYDDEPEWLVVMSGGEARKDSSNEKISRRRPKLLESEKTDEQRTQQQIAAIAEMKVLLGVPQGLISALINNPSHEVTISYEDALAEVRQISSHINLQNVPKEKTRRHILAYGLRRKMVYMAVDEVRNNLRLLDNSCTRVSQLFNNVYLCTYIWVQKLKQLRFVDAVMDDSESDKAIVKLVHTCQELTRWLILCELWPYKSSWLIYKVERVNRKLADFPSSNFYLDGSIRDIYKDIKEDVRGAKTHFESYRQLDYSETSFKKALEKFKDISGLSVLRYLPFTVNIDRSIKNAINKYMSEGGNLMVDTEAENSLNTGLQAEGISADEHNEEE